MEALLSIILGDGTLSLFHDIRMGIISVIVEALPFLLIGSLIAAIVHIYLPEKTLRRFFVFPLPVQIIIAAFTGVIFPLCECAMIPITRNLIKKGLPIPTAIVLLMATPIVNPISVISTHVAFNATIPAMPIYRVLLGVFVSICIGLTFVGFKKEKVIKDADDSYGEGEFNVYYTEEKSGLLAHLLEVIQHTKEEFLTISVYLVIGAVFSTCIYFLMPSSVVTALADNDFAAIPAFGLFGYLVSLCSNADAFLIAPFAGRFSIIALLSFLIISPIIDVKNTFVLLSMFRRKFSFVLLLRVFAIVFVSLTILMLIREAIS